MSITEHQLSRCMMISKDLNNFGMETSDFQEGLWLPSVSKILQIGSDTFCFTVLHRRLTLGLRGIVSWHWELRLGAAPLKSSYGSLVAVPGSPWSLGIFRPEILR